MRNEWRLIDTGENRADWNMAMDEAMLSTFSDGARPVLRLYGWEPSISLGRFQKAAESIDAARLKAHGVACVRRMTGGGALVHGGDLSYSLVFPRSFVKERGVKESYRHLCRFLLRLYDKLGLKAGFAADAGMETGRSAICLAANEAYDIVIGGRKMGGNAQRLTKQGILMHGSLPMRLDAERFDPLFLEPSGLERAASLEQLKVPIEYEELAELVADSFSLSFGAELEKDGISTHEEELAKRLVADKYGTKRWTYDAQSR